VSTRALGRFGLLVMPLLTNRLDLGGYVTQNFLWIFFLVALADLLDRRPGLFLLTLKSFVIFQTDHNRVGTTFLLDNDGILGVVDHTK
jgi:hypothetical protein